MNTTQPIEPKTAEPQELDLASALTLAIHLHRTAELTDAETLYRRILDAAPDNADAMHFLGVLIHQRDKSDAAIKLIYRSIALDPGHADRHNNLGNVLVERGRLSEAAEAYRKSIALMPGHSDAWNNLGAVLRASGQLEEAGSAYLKAIELDPENVNACNNYGNLLGGQGRTKEAIDYYCKAITLAPDNPDSMHLLGIAYSTLGQLEAAAKTYREWLRKDPDNPVAQHMLASCSGENVPKRATDHYISTSFDAFANSFDQKLESLSYRAPQLVADAAALMLGAPAKNLTILDAGCGTGLCGPLIAPFASQLTGVDLSSRMLAAAGTRTIYDQLVHAELSAYLESHPGTFDVIVSADTLVYFGELDGVFGSAARALHPDGLLVFTVEAINDLAVDTGYRLNPHGRYSHSQVYVEKVLRDAGFAAPFIETAVLRMESGSPVSGLVVAVRNGNHNPEP